MSQPHPFDNMTQEEVNAYMNLGVEFIGMMVPVIDAMRQKGATTEHIIRYLEGVIAELKGPTPEELAGEAMMGRQIAEIFREAGIPVIDYETGIEVSVAKH
jgi:hypothetical protein